MKLLEPQQDNIESPIEENISNEVDDRDGQYEDISQNSNESTKLEEELQSNLRNPTPLGNGNFVGLSNCGIIQVKLQSKPTINPKFCVGL